MKKFLVIDDLIATGGTAEAAANLLKFLVESSWFYFCNKSF